MDVTNTFLCCKDVYNQYSGICWLKMLYGLQKKNFKYGRSSNLRCEGLNRMFVSVLLLTKYTKEFERRLKINGISLNVDKVLNIAKTITILII
jgi:hypothetical protein